MSKQNKQKSKSGQQKSNQINKPNKSNQSNPMNLTKLEYALQIEQDKFDNSDGHRIDIITDPERLMKTTCVKRYGLKKSCHLPCHKCWQEVVTELPYPINYLDDDNDDEE